MNFVQSPYSSSRNGKKIDGVVIHTTVGFYQGTINYFKNNDRNVSAHYVISLSGEITQMVLEKDAAHHAGIVSNPSTPVYHGYNPNWNTIGIENVDDNKPQSADRTTQTPILATLVREICQRHSIPIDRKHIVGHRELYDVKSCPGNLNLDLIVQMAQSGTIPVMDEYKEKGISLLDAYRNVRTTGSGAEGNWEAYARSIIENDKRIPALENNLSTANTRITILNTQAEIQAIAFESVKEQLRTAQNKLDEIAQNPPTTVTPPIFKNPVAQFFYKMAQFAEN